MNVEFGAIASPSAGNPSNTHLHSTYCKTDLVGVGLGYLGLQHYDDIEDYLLFSDFKFGKTKSKIKAITTIIFFSIMMNLVLNGLRFILTNLLNKKHEEGLPLNLSRLIQSHLQNLAIFIGIYAYIIHQGKPPLM